MGRLVELIAQKILFPTSLRPSNTHVLPTASLLHIFDFYNIFLYVARVQSIIVSLWYISLVSPNVNAVKQYETSCTQELEIQSFPHTAPLANMYHVSVT
ncbi:hypothetical protein PUN28_013720 [Cardiocondyla obscurior]|uniref:Uncharacterized protein n=1 Tax=Cardiocondyla obscurior TaxID=286306 RepID=A0AAW2F4W3_9HYME